MKAGFLLGAAALLMMPSVAHAGVCEDTFVKKGNPIGGVRFIATTSVADMTPASAISQLRGIVAARGYDILVDEAEAGSMLIEQPMNGKSRAFPIEITAVSEKGVGTVRMEAKLRAGMFVKEADSKLELCQILGQLQGGKAGLAAAARGKSAQTVQAAPLAISAQSLSNQISKDTERNSAAVLPRYTGKMFTVDGTVDYVIKDGDAYRVAYKIPNPWEEVIKRPNAAPFKTDISCMMAKGTGAFSLQLKPGKSIKLTGTFWQYDEFKHIVWLSDCRPEK
jgi:hypothetical protein